MTRKTAENWPFPLGICTPSNTWFLRAHMSLRSKRHVDRFSRFTQLTRLSQYLINNAPHTFPPPKKIIALTLGGSGPHLRHGKSINEVTLRRARLVVRWMTVYNCGDNEFVCLLGIVPSHEFILSSKISYKSLVCLAQKSGTFLCTICSSAKSKTIKVVLMCPLH